MAETSFTKRSFSSGVVSPSLRARTDLNKYQAALAKCENFMVLPEGGAVNRSGFEYLATLLGKSYLVEFQFNQYDSYVVLFSDNLISIFKGNVLKQAIVSTYLVADMYEAQFVQRGDVITIAYIDHKLRTLSRYADTDWRLEDVDFSFTTSPPTNLKIETSGTNSGSDQKTYDYVVTAVNHGSESGQSSERTIITNALSEVWGNRLTWTGAADSYNIYKSISPSTNIYGWIGNSKTNEFTDFNIAPLASEGIVKQSSPFNNLLLTMVNVDGEAFSGQAVKTPSCTGDILLASGLDVTIENVVGAPLAGETLTSERVIVAATGPIKVGSTLTSGTAEGLVVKVDGSDIYVDMEFGDFANGDAITITGNTSTEYVVTLSNAAEPLVVSDAFETAKGVTGTITTISTPVGDQQRFTSTDSTGELSSGEKVYRTLLAYATIDELIITDAPEAGTIDSTPVTSFSGVIGVVNEVSNPSVVNYYQQRLVLANTILSPQTCYASRTGNYYDFRSSEPVGDSDSVEFTLASGQINEIRHILSIKDMVLLTSGGIWRVTEGQEEVLSPRTVGVRKLNSYGSSKIRPLKVGESVLFIQEKGNRVRDLYDLDYYQSDDLSILSQHLFKDLDIISWCYQEDPHGIIWAVRRDGALLGLTYHKGHQLWGWHIHKTTGTINSVCCLTEEDKDVVYITVERGVGIFHLERLSERITDEYKNFTFCDSWIRFTGTPETTFSVPHLDGQDVVIMADGFISRDTVVASTITLNREASDVLIGLPYVSDLETLDLDLDGMNMSGKRVSVPEASIKIDDTVGGKIGASFDKLRTAKWRRVTDNYDALKPVSKDHNVIFDAEWSNNGKVCIRQDEPLPISILAITPRVIIGGK